MRKFAVTLILLTLIPATGFAQDWITLSTPQSSLLGAPISNIRNGDINYNFAFRYNVNPGIVTRESAESMREYEDKFKNWLTKCITSSRVSIQTLSAYGLKVRSLDQETVGGLQVGAKYIYEGIAADSVTITLSTKKEFSLDISKAFKDVSAAISEPQVTKIVEKVAPFLDSVTYTSNDSVFYKVIVKNPNVYYKVKVIKLLKPRNGCGCDWERKCILYFTDMVDNDFPRTIKLEVDYSGEKSSTTSRYPEFCGRDRMDIQYYLKVEEENDGMHLWVYEQPGTYNNSARKKIEVPFKDKQSGEEQIREWRLDRTNMLRFQKGKTLKDVFLEVSARQTGEKSLEILNWREGRNSQGENALTCLKYPEFRGKYVTR